MIKNIKNKKSIVVLCLGLLLILSLCAFLFVGNSGKSVNADECKVETAEPIKSIYLLNDVLTIPNSKLEYAQGQFVDSANSNIVFPDGKKYVGNTFTLNLAGKYVINYSAEKDGTHYYGSVTFSVKENLYSAIGDNATAEYKEGVSLPGYSTDYKKDGVVVSLPVNSEFRFNKAIDFSDKTKADTLLKLYTLPTQKNTAEVGNIIVKLTDAYDENNFVIITTYNDKWLKADPDCNSVYQLANASNQVSTGMLADATGAVSYEGYKFDIVRNSDLGYHGKFSFCGYVPQDDEGHDIEYPFSLSFDYYTKKLFGCFPNTLNDIMIMDLDEPLFFNNLWQGFRTGEAYLSVYSTNYLSSDFNFIITDIYDENLSGSTIIDEVKPIIEIDYGAENPSSIPYGVKNMKYKIFTPKVVDNSGAVDCTTSVYYNYYSNAPINVSLNDGYFTPTKSGTYTIVYYAVDRFGNESIEEIDVNVKGESALNIIKNLNTTPLKTGEPISYTVSAENGSGNVKLSAKAVLKSDNSVTYDLINQGSEFVFVPLYSGEYDIIFTATDYVSEKSVTEKIDALSNEGFVVIGEPSLPYLFIKGASYDIDVLTAYDVKSGKPELVNSTIKYSFDSGEFNDLNGKLKIEADSVVTLKYQFSSTFSKEYSVKVVDVNYGGDLTINKYFYGENFSSIAEGDGSIYTTTTDGAELYFANKLLAVNFELNFRGVKKNYTTQRIELVDYELNTQKLILDFALVGNSQTLVIVNGYANILPIDFTSAQIKLRYEREDKKLSVNGTELGYENFDGFNSNFIKLKTSLGGVAGECAIKIYDINGQPVSNTVMDSIVPALYYDTTGTFAKFEDEFVLSNVVVADVLRVETTFKFSIVDPEGNICVSTDGVKLQDITDISRDYKVKLNKYGTYKIRLNYSDGSNLQTPILNVIVNDVIAPTLSINDKVEKVTLNSEIDFSNFTVSDNVDQNVKVRVYVMDSLGSVTLAENYKYKASVKGSCTVIYDATDAYGNVTSKSYTFIVE